MLFLLLMWYRNFCLYTVVHLQSSALRMVHYRVLPQCASTQVNTHRWTHTDEHTPTSRPREHPSENMNPPEKHTNSYQLSLVKTKAKSHGSWFGFSLAYSSFNITSSCVDNTAIQEAPPAWLDSWEVTSLPLMVWDQVAVAQESAHLKK